MAAKSKNVWSTDIVLVDIINFSKLTSNQQFEIIDYITKSYSKMIEKMLTSSNMTLSRLVLGFISTGDGFYCILNPKLKGYGAILGLSFNHFSEHISKKYPYFEGIKIAVHTGEVHEFRDILGNKNYIGDGLNDCARYLEFKNYTISTVMVSESAYENLIKFINIYKDFHALLLQREFKHSAMHSFHDKHGGEKKGCLIWLRETGIINPPNLKFNSMI
ncbi:MAG: hypothetical protein GW906_05460 [Epsilonproteobacteria bacterium]|nr:hypothetical protein [Campylobacterota bacterium]OIO18029.1 MAG: hypothetical protein AUJ81_00300 [Helicobacteraceae bacterium CG1_02_36_14]PIP09799.1 MAG: hypothetical protein COX50_08790 [Sulfurimonas sp. CG23_combo_of_CG06-09_8_20_14_all_36_33]PIS24013.1 MAG: hypothetical protein COT46_10730 [Sulfurimonas sp. CG08_land_8_20_14_0_20_36_33]PIU35497.1 MAG: hypothetical protein COT05_02870 [Sulfurimonas sp. CG07_land_8_20_14_0_80_36_56]PIV05418.1 MAG: hypothetical protein COS56_01180 [Sulfur